MRIKRSLYILKYIRERGSMENPVTISMIKDFLDNEGIYVDDNTIKRDLKEVMDAGINLEIKHGCHNIYGYYIKSEFSIEEMRFILDSIWSNKFVKSKYKEDISRRLLKKVCSEKRKELRNSIHVRYQNLGPVDVISNIFAIHNAISEKRIVIFHKVKMHRDKTFSIEAEKCETVPLAIYYENDRYYLICKKLDGKERCYRIDRITDIDVGNFHNSDTRVELNRYSIRNFDMFVSDKVSEIVLKIHVSLIYSTIEKFGQEAHIRPCRDDKDYFILSDEASINKGLVRWILKQGSSIEVLYPQSLRNDVIDEVKKMSEIYR